MRVREVASPSPARPREGSAVRKAEGPAARSGDPGRIFSTHRVRAERELREAAMVLGRLQWRVLFGRVVPFLEPKEGKQHMTGGGSTEADGTQSGLVSATGGSRRTDGTGAGVGVVAGNQAGGGCRCDQAEALRPAEPLRARLLLRPGRPPTV